MCPVTISKEALYEIKEIFNTKKVPNNYGLRLTVQGGGCAGVVHKLGFDLKNEQDLCYLDFGFELMIAKKDLMHLIGKHISFIENVEKRGFVFE